jgi:hypothetical protein
MRTYFIILSFSLMLNACNSNSNTERAVGEEAGANFEEEASTSFNNGEKAQAASGDWQRLEMKQFKDAKGNVFCEIPLPQSWKLVSNAGRGQPSITGPNGIKLTDFSPQSFMYTSDPNMQQIYYQSGQQLRAMPEVQQVIEQDLMPWANGQGLQYVKAYEIPEVAKVDKWYSDQLFKAVPSQSFNTAIGTEWKAADGSPFFLLMHLSGSNTAELQMWSYWCTSLQAEPKHFDLAKKQFLFALANAHYPLEPIMEYNRMEAEKAGKSWAAHNQRMAQNQANFEASQRAHVNKTNAINDAIMSGWRERNAASDKAHGQFIDAITERTNVVDPNTGQRYKVSSGYNQYWMNNDGEYISTQQHDYNPNLDENMNNQKWQQLKEVKD